MRGLAAVVLAYACACATVVLIYQTASRGPFTPLALLNGMALTAVTSAPGFVVLRGGLAAARLRAPALFAMAGGLNGLIALSLFFRRPTGDLWFLGMGLVAGAVYWWVERRTARGILVPGKRVAG